ncbi:hypothetical protein ACFSTC_44705 [Nonomuraea ferruginea]
MAAFVLWPQGEGRAGRWTGSATHPSAGRVFPVDIRLDDGGESSMRWGADLHCSGILRPVGDLVYELLHVAGTACHPGTLRMRPIGDSGQMVITVTRQGEEEVTYSGKVARSS